MTLTSATSRYRVAVARNADDLRACQVLRHKSFFGKEGVDADALDSRALHLVVQDAAGKVCGTVRCLPLRGQQIASASYSGQFYALTAFSKSAGEVLEVGRFCVASAAHALEVLRMLWGGLTSVVIDGQYTHMMGCASFPGTDATAHGRALLALMTDHAGPAALRPGVKAEEVVALANLPETGRRQPPALLRSYLSMNGWVSDHAVIDRQMNTLHVFTCVAVADIPPARVRSLRALAPEAALT